ncbi:HAD-IB family phosphatase [Anaerovorax odorimutans]|uniref:HAD-IB family phosphatase n=1 Tax=Anaerovorax odorimutans TaxID=109327 RepID=A0ABT1RT45_9FIRM|nr:HAD-IB family phosphatase [Anaerovorax odorimutans]MCQ4638383.1 HAD-IB family phosphatase [Anaerovorax odorimutans]
MYDKILFIDFDGTITSEDTLDGVLQRLVPRELYEEKAAAMMSGELTLAQVVREGFESIPSDQFPKIFEYLDTVPMREGFTQLLDTADQLNIPVVVISGGLRQMIERKIGHLRDRLLGMHYVELDLSGPNMQLRSDYEEGAEILAKTRVMEQYDYKTALCIGDSYTDINMAAKSDVVFARDKLAQILDQKGISYTPWKDFYDVAEAIKSSK